MVKEKRDSNFELMRIVSMLMIVMWHLLRQGGIFSQTTNFSYPFFLFVEAILVIHVNSFILITGYFQSKSSFQWKKALHLILLIWFYKVFFLIIFLIFNLKSFTALEIFKNLMPINYQDYWFLGFYVILYLLSPYLNKVIDKCSRKEFQILLVLLFFFFSILPTITYQEAYNNQFGYSLGQFIFLYMIGAYLRKEGFSKTFFPKFFKKHENFFYILLIFICVILNVFLYEGGVKFTNSSHTLLNYISVVTSSFLTAYDNPLVIIETICYFLLFKNLKIKSKLINVVASTTIGVYLIHTNKLLRPFVYQVFGYHSFLTSLSETILYLIGSSICLFLICSLLEYIRFKIVFLFKWLKDKVVEVSYAKEL